MAQDPGRVFPGKRMSGHLGSVQRTTQNLVVIRVDSERGLLLVKGAIPGSRGGDVIIHPSVKTPRVGAKPAIKIDPKAGKKAGA